VLTHPTKRVLQALATLEGNADFQEVMAWLQDSVQTIARDGFYVKDEHQARWHQGAGQALTELLEKSSNARETVRKF